MTYFFDINSEKKSCLNFLLSFLDMKIRNNPEDLLTYKNYLLSPEKYLGFYASFPLFFLKPGSHSIEKTKIYKLYSATALYLLYIKAKDDIDDGDIVPLSTDFNYIFFKDWSVDFLKELFSIDSIFWQYFNTFNNEIEVFTKEKHSYIYSYSNVSIDYFIGLAKAKGAAAKFPALAINILANDLTKIDLLFNSINNFNIGYQFVDDLVDFYDDLSKNRLNTFVHFILSKNSINSVSQEEVITLVKTNLKDYLNLALSFYESSLQDVNGLGLKDWENIINKNIYNLAIMEKNIL